MPEKEAWLLDPSHGVKVLWAHYAFASDAAGVVVAAGVNGDVAAAAVGVVKAADAAFSDGPPGRCSQMEVLIA